ncbi:hypothetical protein BC939DRAFT_440436 [Gamsiella multidivaricata]|uniref:uncharacterized protein n=1 Tax=Gamsiella multidivaricata TaxID=101098 RepID=UPI00221E4265|nr:uncharacterized protein BC939DRAFT_440436 [Gamsiella multidivaricata]KAI7829743.1 hypothetical protein BC939DRAFT_440436 [Gamsiella multidivaricata]
MLAISEPGPLTDFVTHTPQPQGTFKYLLERLLGIESLNFEGYPPELLFPIEEAEGKYSLRRKKERKGILSLTYYCNKPRRGSSGCDPSIRRNTKMNLNQYQRSPNIALYLNIYRSPRCFCWSWASMDFHSWYSCASNCGGIVHFLISSISLSAFLTLKALHICSRY